MKNADKPIYPDPMRGAEQSYTNQSPHELPNGLTKREYFAGLAMQGLCANSIPGAHHSFENLTKEAIAYADELLKQLETTQD